MGEVQVVEANTLVRSEEVILNLLTVCIPTIPSRHSTLSRLLWVLQPQALDVVIAGGEGAMGDKLNACFEAAKTPYVVCVDDDDMVTHDYVEAMWFSSATKDLDVGFIGYDIAWLENGVLQGMVKHHLDGDPDWGSHDRGVSPKCPVSTDIARSVPFGNEYIADRVWSKHVHNLLNDRYGLYIPRALYIYDHWNDHMVGTAKDQGMTERKQRDVGQWPYDPSRFTWL